MHLHKCSTLTRSLSRLRRQIWQGAVCLSLAVVLPAIVRAADCALYPIAIHIQTLAGKSPGDPLPDIYNGAGPGNFGWLTWAGSPSVPTLANSLTPPGDSHTYVNPGHSADRTISLGDWIQDKPGVSNSKYVRNALDALKQLDIMVPVWDQARTAKQDKGGGGDQDDHSKQDDEKREMDEAHDGKQRRSEREDLKKGRDTESKRGVEDRRSEDEEDWNAEHEQPPGTLYHVATFARIRLLSYHLPGQNRISARFLGYVTCGAINRPPVVNAGPDQIILSGAAASLNGLASDDGLPALAPVLVNWSLVSGPGTVIFANAGTAATSATFSAPGAYVLRLAATDTELAASDDVVIIVNSQPVADDQSLTTAEDTPLNITLAASDPDGGPLTFILVSAPTNGTLPASLGTLTSPNLTYTPNPNAHGSDSFQFEVTDGLTNSAPATVTIAVTPVNDAPGLSPIASQTTAEGSPLIVTSLAGDVDAGDALTFSLTNAPFGMQINPTNGVITWTSSEAQGPSTNVVTVIVTDDGSPILSASQSFSLVVSEVNTAPVLLAIPDQDITEGQLLVVTNHATDLDLPANVPTFSLAAGAPAGMAIEPLTGLVTWTPGEAQANLFHFVIVVVTDNGQPSLSATQSFGVTVRRMNRPPVISLTSAFASEAGQPVALTASVTDDGLPTGGTLSVRWEPVSGPGQVTSPTLDGASITVIVSAAGEYQFRLTATDGELISTAMTTLVATMSNVAPLVTAGPNQFVRLPNSVTFPGFVTDDGRPVGAVVSALWSVVSGPGMVTFAEPAATNTSATFSAVGDYVLRLTANDTALTGHTDARIAVRDELVNQPPFVNAGQDIQAGLTYAVFLSGTVTDDGLPAGNSLQVGWQLVSGSSAVEFESTNHTATMATFAQSGRYVLRLSASDGQFTVSDELVVDVFATNLPPTVEAGPNQVLLVPDPALLTAGGAQPRDPHTSLAMSLFGEARWNNTVGQPGLVGDWAGLLNGLDYSDGNVVVTGPFDTAGGVYVRGLARWDGTNFWPYYDPRPTDPNDPLSPPFGYIEDEHPETRIRSIGASGREVFASGGFLRDPRGSGNGVLTARWDGEHWLPWDWHGQSRYVGVSDILVGRDRAVYVAGNFSFQPTNSGGGLITYPDLPISYGVAKWTGSHWTNLADGVRTYADTGSGIQLAAGAYVSAVAEGKNGEIYVSGLFDMPTPFGGATNIAVWNGTNWAPLGTGIQGCYRYACNPSPRALAVDDDGRLYVGGDIAFAGGVPVRNLAMWDGANWHDVGGGVAYEVLALATHGRDLYVGPAGEAGGIPVNGIARWNGSFWSPLGSGSTNGIVGSPMSMVATPRGIYVAGAFQTAGGQPARNIAFWEFPEEPERFVRLNGRVTDDGLPYAGAVSQQWAKASGPGEVIFADAASPMTTATFTAVGTYVLRLTANDTEHTVLDEVVIEVRANQPPVVNAGPDLAVPLTDKPVLPGAVTDDGLPSNASLVSVWTQVGGPANARITNPNQPGTQVEFSVPGTYVFRLQANDSQFSVFDDVTVVVASANNPPTISSYVPGRSLCPRT